MHFRAQKKNAQDVSLSDHIETGSDGAPLELMDVVCQEDDMLDRLACREQTVQLRQAIGRVLTDQEQQVIRLRYGLDGNSPQRQRQVAQVIGISRSYVSRIEKRALEKLKAALE